MSSSDLIVCKGRYVDPTTHKFTRKAHFLPSSFSQLLGLRRSLFFGFTPPHQATFFGKGVINVSSYYDKSFRLAADLDYFLRVSLLASKQNTSLYVKCVDSEVIHMSAGGVSSRQTIRRLYEVCLAYYRSFGFFFWFPFLMRYISRFFLSFTF